MQLGRRSTIALSAARSERLDSNLRSSVGAARSEQLGRRSSIGEARSAQLGWLPANCMKPFAPWSRQMQAGASSVTRTNHRATVDLAAAPTELRRDRAAPTELRRPSCADRAAPTELRRPSCADRAAPTELRRPSCADRAAPTELRRPSCADRAAPTELRRLSCADRAAPTASCEHGIGAEFPIPKCFSPLSCFSSILERYVLVFSNRRIRI